MLESWFSGILTPAEMISADRYSLFVGVVKKRYVWILLGILVCQTFFSRILFLRGGSLSCIYFRGHRLRTDDACGRLRDSALLRLIFPQGIFYALAGYLLWTVVSELWTGKKNSVPGL